MGTKVEVRTIPLHGLFIHRKQVWRSLGKLRQKAILRQRKRCL